MDLKTANRLYELRKAKGYSQDELADLIGVSRQAVSKWERGESSPDTDNLITLAKLYGVSIDELLDYQPQNAQNTQSTQNDQNSQDAQSGQNAQNAQNGQAENADDKNSQKSNVFIRINADGVEIHAPADSNNCNNIDGDDIKDINFEVCADDDEDDVDDEDCEDDDDDFKDGTVDGKKHRFNVHLEEDGIRITSNGKQMTQNGVHIEFGDHPKNRNQAIKSAVWGGVFLLSIVAYLVMGFVAKLWHPGWIIFFAPIIADGFVDTIIKRNPNHFPVAMLSTAAFLLLGFLGGWWHPGWIVFLAIPAYFAIVSPIYSVCKKKVEVCANCEAEQEDIDDQQDDDQE